MIIKGKSEEFKKLAESIAKLTRTKVVEDENGCIELSTEDKRLDIHFKTSGSMCMRMAGEISRFNPDKYVLVGEPYLQNEEKSDSDIWVFDSEYYIRPQDVPRPYMEPVKIATADTWKNIMPSLTRALKAGANHFELDIITDGKVYMLCEFDPYGYDKYQKLAYELNEDVLGKDGEIQVVRAKEQEDE